MVANPAISDQPDKPIRLADGTVRYLHAISVPLLDDKGTVEYILCIAEDITQRRAQELELRAAERALRESESRLRTIANTMPAMVAYIDAGQVYRFNNLAYEREFGSGGGQMVGKTILQAVGAARYANLQPYIERVLDGETVVFEEHDETEGRDRALEVTYIPQMGADGVSVLGFHVMRHDITTQKREKKRLLKLSQIDPLTGLANRAGFMEKLESAMRECAADKHLMAVMYMDIDRFKPVNDTYGHNVGDALLKAFSARLAHNMRASDTIARLGGDEFTIIMEKIARPEDASHTAAKIVAAMQAPFELGGLLVSVSASIGLAYFSGGEVDPAALLHQADMLLYQSKQAGRNTWRAGDPALAESS
jgi:diguanylate cyclase (GGDEF)-like protein/PAS domain S-box-containing protein